MISIILENENLGLLALRRRCKSGVVDADSARSMHRQDKNSFWHTQGFDMR
jgi:hypothetical protein